MSGDEESQEGFVQQQDGELIPSRDGSVDETMEEGVAIGDAQNGGHAEATESGASATGAEASYGSKVSTRGDDDDKKIFVGGLHWETTAADLREYFSKFGTVVDCTLKTDQATGRSRGFGFILFEDCGIVQKILADKTHNLRGRQIDCKPAQSSRPSAGVKAEPIKKVFVGGLSPDIPETDIREYFGQYGKIEEVELPFDKMKNQRRAFCFITYETEEMVDKAVVNAKQKLGDREVDVRKATPRSEHDSGRGGRGGGMMRGAPRGGYNPAYAGGYGMPAYDYSAYYGMPGYGYGYPGYNPYDYSSYYGAAGGQQAADWSAYAGYAAAAYAGQQPMAGVAPGAGAGGGYKAKRGGHH